MKPKVKSYALITGATNNVAAAQTPSGAGNLTLTSLLSGDGRKDDLAYILTFTAVSDESTKSVTITGFDEDMHAQSEVVTLPNATIKSSAKYWRRVTSIAVSAGTTGNISVGTPNSVASAVTPSYCLDMNMANTSIAVNISGTINYDLQKCFQRLTAGDVPNWEAGGLTGKTADDNTAYTGPTGAARVKINSYTNGATLTVSFAQAR